MASRSAPASSKIFHEDVVRRDGHDEAGVVLRCWYDPEEEIQLTPEEERMLNGIDRRLNKNEVGVAFYPSATREILKESDVRVIDRSFQVGDVCKRSIHDVSSGVVLAVDVELELSHAMSKKKVDGRVPSTEVKNTLNIISGDHIMYGDWVGVVEEVFEEALVESGRTSELVRVCDIGARLTVGEAAEDMLGQSSFLSSLFPSRQNRSKSKILEVKQTVLCLNWLGINQKLTPAEQEQRPRPKRYWTELDKLTLVRGFADNHFAVGDKVVFRSKELEQKYGVERTKHGNDQFEVNVLNVIGTHTNVKVIWQDGSVTTEHSTSIIPYLNLDEYDVWPGDWVMWKGEGQQRVATVQNVDPEQRIAEVRWYGTDEREVVPVLELDVHGPEPATWGVRRGDVVFISDRGNGQPLPSLPRIGESEILPDDVTLRSEMGDLGMEVAKSSPDAPSLSPRQGKDAPEIDWYGEVVDMRTDGKIIIRLPCGRLVEESLEYLTLLQDGFDEDAGAWADGQAYEGDEMEDVSEGGSEGSWETEEGGKVWDGEKDDWEDMDVEEEAVGGKESADRDAKAAEAVDGVKAASVEPPTEASTSQSSSATRCPSPSQQSLPVALPTSQPVDNARWSRFEVLDDAPADHAFYNQPVSTGNKAFFSRLQKEFKVLQTSLPESILVRSYEDRTDLLRVLIMGPENTPYEDAPFLIDFYVKPDRYPYEAPVAHFHSWTNGNGRVSPNLYEEGKVCLSVLNTWQGERSESWNPQKSSLLQVFVSIQGLVLVREPWFTEPAYEKLRGTEEGIVNSRLYSEKAFILSRNFIRRALEQPISGLEDEIRFFYFGGDGQAGRLAKVLERSRRLVEEAERGTRKESAESGAGESSGSGTAVAGGGSGVGEGQAVDKLSGGGAIMLKRTIVALEKLTARHEEESGAA